MLNLLPDPYVLLENSGLKLHPLRRFVSFWEFLSKPTNQAMINTGRVFNLRAKSKM